MRMPGWHSAGPLIANIAAQHMGIPAMQHATNQRNDHPWWLWAFKAAVAAAMLAHIGAGRAAAAESSGQGPSPAPIDYFIVVTGREILEGAYADSHTHFLTRTLRPLGLHCAGSLIVDDRVPDILEALRFAVRRAALVIVTGGLGPTDNDVTREALVQFTGIAVREDAAALGELARRFQTPPEQLRPNLRRQVRVPERGGWLKNPNGTAVGLVFEMPERVIVALPGPPRELQPMVRNELVGYLGRRFGTRPAAAALTLRFVGLGQSQIDHALKQHVALPPGVVTSSQFDGLRVDFSFSVPEDSPAARQRLDALKAQILALPELRDCLYADDPTTTLEEQVVALLERRGTTLAVVELASGGRVLAGLLESPRAAGQVAGIAGDDAQSLCRLLSVADDLWRAAPAESRLELLGLAAAKATGAAWTVVVGPALPSQEGRPAQVDVVFCGPDGKQHRRFSVRGGPSWRSYLATEVLDQLRRRLRPDNKL